MRRIIYLSAVAFTLAGSLQAQVLEKWDLKRCVDYAMKNSINVRQAEITRRSSEIALKQSELAQILSAGPWTVPPTSLYPGPRCSSR
jgi:outer membrane protein